MTDQKPTGVFVPLHEGQLGEDQIAKICNPKRTMTESLIAIGTPVAGGDLETFTNRDPSVGNVYVTYVRQSDAQAQIAARDTEIVRDSERLDGCMYCDQTEFGGDCMHENPCPAWEKFKEEEEAIDAAREVG